MYSKISRFRNKSCYVLSKSNLNLLQTGARSPSDQPVHGACGHVHATRTSTLFPAAHVRGWSTVPPSVGQLTGCRCTRGTASDADQLQCTPTCFRSVLHRIGRDCFFHDYIINFYFSENCLWQTEMYISKFHL